ncbi:hypothetical protein [Vagococcus martis]|uniref:hypothetical protein n=1 Tax=Vagococcus martis TaxID=1768210 RepID=UPI001E48C55D|nr:hypothetical protein [Vagococcus martis]
MNPLIVYYSRSKNTQVIAELIRDKVDRDLFQIETKEKRLMDCREEVNQQEQEQINEVLPE